jgi:peptide deformylase
MAVRQIVVVPDQVLNQHAQPIHEISDEIRALARDMADTMYLAPGIGLAANQVGELLKIIVVDVKYAYAEPADKKKDPLVILNPEITLCEGQSVKEEGCLSVPEFGVDVTRSECVQVTGQDMDGNPLSFDAEGLLARVLQHEIDHLNGTTLLDHASSLKRGLYKRRIRKQARRSG